MPSNPKLTVTYDEISIENNGYIFQISLQDRGDDHREGTWMLCRVHTTTGGWSHEFLAQGDLGVMPFTAISHLIGPGLLRDD